MSQRVPHRLDHILWIGGSACGGKTSTARLLAEDYGLRFYSCDEAYERHCPRVDPRRHPHFHCVMNKTYNQLFMPSAAEQVAEITGFYQEQFDMVLDDLLSLPQSDLNLVEGAGLLPARVVTLLKSDRQAVWLVPTAGFRASLTRLEEPGVQELVGGTDNPALAFRNWMQRDVLFTRQITDDAHALGLKVLVNDGQQTIPQRAAEVARHFRL